jgi:large subunit ribosomal protein L15e
MGYLKYVRELWTKPKKNMAENYRNYLIAWRKEEVTVRIDRPTRPDRARSLGYSAKPGIIVIRQRVSRGGRQRPDISGGRRPKKNTNRLTLAKSYQLVAEERVARKHPNCEVAGSYLVGKDGLSAWYEVILYDRDHPQIRADPKTAWAYSTRGKVFRGRTSAGKKSRGISGKGKGYEKMRPSQSAVRAKKVQKGS